MTIMERVDNALSGAGIPAFPIVWRPTEAYPNEPDLYATYQRIVSVPELGTDDQNRVTAHYARVTIHGSRDPADTVETAKAALEAAGLMIREERDDSDVDADDYYIVLSAVYYEDNL